MSTIVLKPGGEILSPERAAEASAIAADVATLLARGDRVIAVHGGGPQSTALQKALGQEPRIIGGRRVTDDAQGHWRHGSRSNLCRFCPRNEC